jgi:hypothetical protein
MSRRDGDPREFRRILSGMSEEQERESTSAIRNSSTDKKFWTRAS